MSKKYGLLVGGLLLLAFALVGCNAVIGNGDVIEETRDLDSFSRIDISGAGDVVVEYGDSESVRIEAESNLMEYLETTVSGDTLEISTRDNTSLNTSIGYTFYVTVTELEGMTISGAADVNLPDVVTENDFTIRVSGAGDVVAESLQAESLTVDISGAGSVRVDGGEVESQDVTLSGAGDYRASDLISQDAEVDLSGAGGITLYASGELSGSVSGAGSVRYTGDPETVNVNVTGAGSVSALD
jgi:predicted small secreted protein